MNITHVNVYPSRVWKPDVVLYDRFVMYEIRKYVFMLRQCYHRVMTMAPSSYYNITTMLTTML